MKIWMWQTSLMWMHRKIVKLLLIIVAGSACFASTETKTVVEAKTEPQVSVLGQQGAWTAFCVKGSKSYCYVSSEPRSGKTGTNKRQSVRLLVTVKSEPMLGEVNYIAGTVLDEKTNAMLKLSKQDIPLLCKKDSAWTKDPHQDKLIVAAFKKEKNCTIIGATEHGQKVQDTFDLKGFTKAYDLAQKTCNSLNEKAPKETTKA
jgi:invasion protein IalB